MGRKGREERDTFTCPHCGADVPSSAERCWECGSDAQTGWSEDAHVWDADIPAGYGTDEGFEYDEFVEKEFPDQAELSPERLWKRRAWTALIVIVSLALLIYALRL